MAEDLFNSVLKHLFEVDDENDAREEFVALYESKTSRREQMTYIIDFLWQHNREVRDCVVNNQTSFQKCTKLKDDLVGFLGPLRESAGKWGALTFDGEAWWWHAQEKPERIIGPTLTRAIFKKVTEKLSRTRPVVKWRRSKAPVLAADAVFVYAFLRFPMDDMVLPVDDREVDVDWSLTQSDLVFIPIARRQNMFGLIVLARDARKKRYLYCLNVSPNIQWIQYINKLFADNRPERYHLNPDGDDTGYHILTFMNALWEHGGTAFLTPQKWKSIIGSTPVSRRTREELDQQIASHLYGKTPTAMWNQIRTSLWHAQRWHDLADPNDFSLALMESFIAARYLSVSTTTNDRC